MSPTADVRPTAPGDEDRSRYLPWERAILVLAAILLSVFGALASTIEGRFDPMAVRAAISLVALGGFAGSFRFTWVRQHLRGWVIAVGYLMLIWFQVLGTMNGLQVANAVTGVLVAIIVPSFARSWFEIGCFAAVATVTLLVSHSLVPEPGVPLSISLLLFLSIIIGLGGFSLSRVSLERALDETNATLEARVQERTRDLESTNSALREEMRTRKRAEVAALAANQAKSIFLANMSHELRTPLNAVLGYAELLQDDLVDQPDAVDDLSKIHDAAHHLLAILQDILDLSKLESDSLTLENAPVDLAPLLTEVCRQQEAPLFVERRNTMVLEACTMVVRGDRRRLHQVFSNLISNAMKFTSGGSVTVIGAIRDGGVEITVEDTGMGMSQAFLSRALESFEMADASSTRAQQGAGLGLSLAHGLITAMGGTLAIESEVGVGTRVLVSLPQA